jgi:soluble lytic murein transglycosylase-like protein
MQGVPVSPPPPSAPIPRSPAALVRVLQQTERRLDAAIGSWDVSRPPPRDVTLLALYEQRIVRLLATQPRLAEHVTEQVPAVEADVAAIRELMQLAHGSPRPAAVHIGSPPPAGRLLAWYRAAQRRFGVRWELLAAVNYTESAFGKVRSASGAGAQGPMQFMPSTWAAYGLGGDVHDPHDAILGAANVLALSGARTDERAALYRYNHSALYVDAVLRYARAIARDPHRFLVYYSRQVYARTASGIRRITGPR